MSVQLNSALTLNNMLKAWTPAAFASGRPEAALASFEAFLLNPPALPPAGGVPAPPRAPLHLSKDPADPLRVAAKKYTDKVLTEYKTRRFPEYEAFRLRGSFAECTEKELLGYIVNKATTAHSPGQTCIAHINNTELPGGLAKLVNDIETCATIWDAGATRRQDTLTSLTTKLSEADRPAFTTSNPYARAQAVAAVPYPATAGITDPGKSSATKSLVGAIRSAHCDNDKVLGERPVYTLTPLSGPSRNNICYLWLELFTAFDYNQAGEAARLWPALAKVEGVAAQGKKPPVIATRVAAERISYIEYTAGEAGWDVNTPQARLVYDYTKQKGMFFSFHYVQEQHAAYCDFHGMKQFFKIIHNGAAGKASPQA